MAWVGPLRPGFLCNGFTILVSNMVINRAPTSCSPLKALSSQAVEANMDRNGIGELQLFAFSLALRAC